MRRIPSLSRLVLNPTNDQQTVGLASAGHAALSPGLSPSPSSDPGSPPLRGLLGSTPPPRPAADGRNIWTVALNTTFKVRKNAAGESVANVTDPGHVQLRPTRREQEMYGLPEALGHGPRPGTPTSIRTVVGTLSDGTTFKVKGLVKEPAAYGADKPIAGHIEVDHGELSPAQAEILKGLAKAPLLTVYETSGELEANCVHGHKEAMKRVFDVDIDIQAHTLPQEIAEKVKSVRAGPRTPDGSGGTGGRSGGMGPGGADPAPAVAPHVAAVVRMAGNAARILELVAQEQNERARALASELLDPQLLTQLNGAWNQGRTIVGDGEASAMNIANAHFMGLLAELAERRLLGAREIFDGLRAAGAAGPEDASYLLQLATRIGQYEHRQAAPQLVEALMELLDTLARVLEGEGDSAEARGRMRRALLMPARGAQRKPDHRYGDFYSQLALGEPTRTPPRAALEAVRSLRKLNLMPSRREIKNAGLSGARADKLAAFERKADKDREHAPARPEAPRGLEARVRELARLDVAEARAADRAKATEKAHERARRQREEQADFEIYSAVDSAVNARWEQLAGKVRKEIARTAPHACADASIATHVPTALVHSVRDCLMSTLQGKAVKTALVASGMPYRAEEYGEFHRMLESLAGAPVSAVLGEFALDIQHRARQLAATWDAQDKAARAELASALSAGMDRDSSRVRTSAQQPATAHGGVPHIERAWSTPRATATRSPPDHATPLPASRPMPQPQPQPQPQHQPAPRPEAPVTPIAPQRDLNQVSFDQTKWFDVV